MLQEPILKMWLSSCRFGATFRPFPYPVSLGTERGASRRWTLYTSCSGKLVAEVVRHRLVKTWTWCRLIVLQRKLMKLSMGLPPDLSCCCRMSLFKRFNSSGRLKHLHGKVNSALGGSLRGLLTTEKGYLFAWLHAQLVCKRTILTGMRLFTRLGLTLLMIHLRLSTTL